MSNIIEQHTTTSLRPSSYHYVIIDSAGNIFQQNSTGSTQVGVTINRYNEVENLLAQTLEKAESYEAQLVEAGVITKPLTQEEQIRLLTDQVSQLTGLVQSMAVQTTAVQNQTTVKPVEPVETPQPATNAKVVEPTQPTEDKAVIVNTPKQNNYKKA